MRALSLAKPEELRAQVERLERDYLWYRHLFEAGPEPHFVTDANGRIVDANQAAGELLGIGPAPLAGQLLPAFVDVNDRRAARAALLEASRTGEPKIVELRLVHRGDRARVVEARALRHARPDGVQVSWFLRDVTQARETERTLRTLTESLQQRLAEGAEELERVGRQVELAGDRLDVLVQQFPFAVVVVDAATGEVALANQQARDLFPVRDPAGSRLAEPELLSGDGAVLRPAARPLARVIRSGETITAERFTHSNADGTTLTLEVSAAPLRDRAGTIAAGMLVAQDVTGRERRDRAEREFLSNAAHQLRTPVAAIQSAVDVLEAGGKDDLLARDRFIGHIARASARLAQLSHSLLVLARAQGGVPARRELVEVGQLLRDVAELVRPLPDVRVLVRCRRDLVVLANRDLLREALSSLVDNAVRYTRRGQIVLRGRRNGGREVILEIADTGSGISPDVQTRMFERFYGDADRGSFGLGLAIAAQAARAMDARLEVDTESGKGTAVRLMLPAGMLRTT